MEAGPRDLRRYARSTQWRLALGGLALLGLVGGGLIWAIWGPAAATLGLLCAALGLLPIVLIALGLWAFERFARAGRGG